MTGGNSAFPSGNAEPTTIADWDYMLPLFKTYFEAAKMKDYAPLIIPSNGYFGLGELINGFGVGSNYYIENGKVKYGALEDGFYNYLQKMKEWYAKGYIYKDFASRTNDPFYLPNTSLTYGGAAGVWYGLVSQLGGAMSMPQYGLIFDVQPAKNPLDAEHGITKAAPFARTPNNQLDLKGSAITTACKNIPKLLAVMDYLFSDEGGMLYNGLTKEQGADTDPIYLKAGLQDGAYWLEGDTPVFNPLLSRAGGTLNHEPFMANQLPGMWNNSYENKYAAPEYKLGDAAWGAYEDAPQTRVSSSVSRPTGDDKIYSSNNAAINDYVSTSVPKFIIGTTPLNDQTWTEFKTRLRTLGIEENLRIQQEAYNRYLAR
jgi:putative aldouronate transport system substrate-binding protein